jgi:hypothetical protein
LTDDLDISDDFKVCNIREVTGKDSNCLLLNPEVLLNQSNTLSNFSISSTALCGDVQMNILKKCSHKNKLIYKNQDSFS